jgi:hypothetical protein
MKGFIKELLREGLLGEEIFKGTILERGKPIWEPLYNFFEHIFGDVDLKKASNSMMYMNKVNVVVYDVKTKEVLDEILELYYYKHGISRHGLLLDINGQPYDIVYDKAKNWEYTKNRIEILATPILKVEKIDYKKAFDIIYSDIDKTLQNIDPDNKLGNNKYFISYVDFITLRDKFLKDKGYNIMSDKEIYDKYKSI